MNCHLSEITELKYTSLIKMIILEENFKWHLEAFASELFIYIYRQMLELWLDRCKMDRCIDGQRETCVA